MVETLHNNIENQEHPEKKGLSESEVKLLASNPHLFDTLTKIKEQFENPIKTQKDNTNVSVNRSELLLKQESQEKQEIMISPEHQKFIIDMALTYQQYLQALHAHIQGKALSGKDEHYAHMIQRIEQGIQLFTQATQDGKTNKSSLETHLTYLFPDESEAQGVMDKNFLKIPVGEKEKTLLANATIPNIRNIIGNIPKLSPQDFPSQKVQLLELLRTYDVANDIHLNTYQSGEAIKQLIFNDVINTEDPILKPSFEKIKQLIDVNSSNFKELYAQSMRGETTAMRTYLESQGLGFSNKVVQTITKVGNDMYKNKMDIAKDFLKQKRDAITELKEKGSPTPEQAQELKRWEMIENDKSLLSKEVSERFQIHTKYTIQRLMQETFTTTILESKSDQIKDYKNSNNPNEKMIDMYANIQGVGDYLSDESVNAIVESSKQLVQEIIIGTLSFQTVHGVGMLGRSAGELLSVSERVRKINTIAVKTTEVLAKGTVYNISSNMLREGLTQRDVNTLPEWGQKVLEQISLKNILVDASMFKIIKECEVFRNTWKGALAENTSFNIANISINIVAGSEPMTADEFIQNVALGALLQKGTHLNVFKKSGKFEVKNNKEFNYKDDFNSYDDEGKNYLIRRIKEDPEFQKLYSNKDVSIKEVKEFIEMRFNNTMRDVLEKSPENTEQKRIWTIQKISEIKNISLEEAGNIYNNRINIYKKAWSEYKLNNNDFDINKLKDSDLIIASFLDIPKGSESNFNQKSGFQTGRHLKYPKHYGYRFYVDGKLGFGGLDAKFATVITTKKQFESVSKRYNSSFVIHDKKSLEGKCIGSFYDSMIGEKSDLFSFEDLIINKAISDLQQSEGIYSIGLKEKIKRAKIKLPEKYKGEEEGYYSPEFIIEKPSKIIEIIIFGEVGPFNKLHSKGGNKK